MLSGADLRQVLQAGLWEALADGSDRAAMRATCRDARDMANELHDTAVLPVGPGTWGSGGTIAAYHRQLGAVRSLHVVYSGGAEDDEARAVHFIEAYSTALGAALPAADCTIAMNSDRQLPTALASVLLPRIVPHVEQLDMALGSYGNLEQLLQALEPCARLCSLRLLPVHVAEGEPDLDDQDVRISFGPASAPQHGQPGALEALCRLPRALHTLSGPWEMEASHLQRLCDALPSLTTLGFKYLCLDAAPGACISRRLHTLAPWHCRTGHESLRLDRPWHLQDSTCCVAAPHNLQAALPAVRHLDALELYSSAMDLPAMQAVAQRFAACAERWAWNVVIGISEDLQGLLDMAPGSLAALKHLGVGVSLPPADVASALGGLVSAAPNITTLMVCCGLGSYSPQVLTAVMQPLRRAAHLRTLWMYDDLMIRDTAAWQAALLEGVARCLAQPGAEGVGDERCRALRHVLLDGAQPDALAACRAALSRDGICVSVDACDIV